MNATLPIPPVDGFLEGAASIGKTPAIQPASLDALAQRFESMMSQGAKPADEVGKPNLVSQFLEKQDAASHQTFDEINALKETSHLMSPQELSMRTMEMANKSSINSFRMQAAVGMASGANKSLQKLLDNK